MFILLLSWLLEELGWLLLRVLGVAGWLMILLAIALIIAAPVFLIIDVYSSEQIAGLSK